MPERSLRVVKTDKTFFNKISNTLTKLLIPTRVSFNSVLITLKRNSLLKAYEAYTNTAQDDSKKEILQNKYEDAYTLYLESIDKFIMDSIYKKVKNDTATPFEREALSKYYTIVQLKDVEYVEYKHKKQKFLLELDYESIKNGKKEKAIEKYNNMYVKKMDTLYKGILKNYSVQLSDSYKMKVEAQKEIYRKIYDILEEYVVNILPIKIKQGNEEIYNKIMKDYEEVEKFAVGKLDERDNLEKNMLLLGISRQLFTHSLPLAAAEQCYNQLLETARNLIVNAKNEKKKEDAYKTLLLVVKDYNLKLLATKVYWEKPNDKEDYKKIWQDYDKLQSEKEKEIVCLKSEIVALRKLEKDNSKIEKIYKNKLVEYVVMKNMKNTCKTIKDIKYTKKVLVK